MQLSARRAKFVEEYVLDHNGSRAARAAGYALSGARVTAHRLLTDANVKAAIEAKARELAYQYELTKQGVIKELRTAIEVAQDKLDGGAMIRGWMEIAKIMGFYAPEVQKLILSGENEELRAKFESMSDVELMGIVYGQ